MQFAINGTVLKLYCTVAMVSEESKRLLITCFSAVAVLCVYAWTIRPDHYRVYSVLVNYYTPTKINSLGFNARYTFSDDVDLSEMSLPFPSVTAPVLDKPWMKDLRYFLQNEASSNVPVAVVAANYLYLDVLVNWLIASKLRVRSGDPIENILIVALDAPLHSFLQEVGFRSIYVSINETVVGEGIREYLKLLITRVTVLRAINYLGFDVVHYDIDAIVLKNPLGLYDRFWDSDIVGSTGKFPWDLGGLWGFTICMGVILFRSTPQTELFWEVYSIGTIMDDQKRINYALVDLNVTWDGVGAADQPRQGKGLEGFKITAMAQTQVCRMDGCHVEDADEYYIWHKGGPKTRESKIATTSAVGGWSLREDWEKMETTSARGVEWLKMVTEPTTPNNS